MQSSLPQNFLDADKFMTPLEVSCVTPATPLTNYAWSVAPVYWCGRASGVGCGGRHRATAHASTVECAHGGMSSGVRARSSGPVYVYTHTRTCRGTRHSTLLVQSNPSGARSSSHRVFACVTHPLSEPPGPTCTVSVCTETIIAAVPSHSVGRTRAASVEMLAYDCLHCAHPPRAALHLSARAMRAEGWALQGASGCREEVFSVNVIPSMACPLPAL